MDWYEYVHEGQRIIRPMRAGQASRLGATLVPGFDPVRRVAGLVAKIISFPPEGEFEAAFDLLAEMPRRR